jgi:hypothetical protein
MEKRPEDDLSAIVFYLNHRLPIPDTLVLRGLCQFTLKYHTIMTESTGPIIVPKDVIDDFLIPRDLNGFNVKEASEAVRKRTIIPSLN